LELGRGIAQAVSGLLPISAARVRKQIFKHASSGIPTANYKTVLDHAIDHAISGLLPNAAARVPTHVVQTCFIRCPDSKLAIGVMPCHNSDGNWPDSQRNGLGSNPGCINLLDQMSRQ
jgi:hypothetical protein